MEGVDQGLREKQAHRQRIDSFLARTREPAAPYTTIVLGREFVIQPAVFSPRYYAETAFYTALGACLQPGRWVA